jgi:hypothetical protein
MKDFILDKVMLLNAGAMTLSFMEIESLLKIVLLIISIIYTIIKIIYKKGDTNLDEQINKFLNRNKKDSSD